MNDLFENTEFGLKKTNKSNQIQTNASTVCLFAKFLTEVERIFSTAKNIKAIAHQMACEK